MKKTASSYYLNQQERKIIKQLIDKRYGKITTPIDYESTGEYSSGIELEIINVTKERISGSTLERLVGLRGENRGVRKSTLIVVANYLEFNDLEFFQRKIEHLAKKKDFEQKQFDTNDFFKEHFIKIIFNTNKTLSLRFVSSKKFEIISQSNTKFLINDIIEILQLEVGYSFICNNVERIINGKNINMGIYNSSPSNIVKNILFYK